MPYQRALASVLLLLIPVFGLTSCSKDKPTDDWAMSEPNVVGTDVSLKLSTASDRTLPADSQITFTGPAWTQMRVHSTCTSGDKKANDDFSFTYRDSIHLKSLWPRELIAKLPATDLAQSECDLHFTAQNERGSTQEFEILHTHISKFSSDSASFALWLHQGASWAAADISGSSSQKPRSFSLESDSGVLNKVVMNLLKEVGQEGDLSLICGDSLSTVDVNSSSTPDLHALAAKLSLTDVQSCHLAAVHRTESNEFAISEDFPLRFSKALLRIQSHFDFLGNSNPPSGLKIEINNQSDFESSFSLPKTVPPVVFHYAGEVQSNPALSPNEKRASMDLNVQGAAPISDNGSVVTYRLSARSSAAVTLSSRELAPCPNYFITSMQVIGLKYGFANAFEIHQTDDGGVIFAAPVWTDVYHAASAIIPQLQDRYGPTVPDGTPILAQGPMDRCL